jgi:general secretion pathway protein C
MRKLALRVGMVLLGMVAVGLSAQGVWTPPQTDAPAKPNVTSAKSADKLLTNNPFDSTKRDLRGGAPPPPNDDGPVATRCDGVEVHAILAADPEWSFASLSTKGGRSSLRRAGGELDGRTVALVAPDYVVLESNGRTCRVGLYDKPDATPAGSSSAAPARPVVAGRVNAIQGIERVNDGEYRIERSTVEKLLENQGELMSSAQVAPEKENGKVVGLRLMRLKPGSALAQIGLREGDRLASINGFDLTSPESGLMAYARLREAPKIVMTVVRDGKPMELRYEVR